MKETWTRQEIEDELLRLRGRSISSSEYEAVCFVLRKIAEHYPARNRIID